MLLNLVTTASVLNYITFASAAVVVVAGFFGDFSQLAGGKIAANSLFKLRFFLLQLLQSYFKINKSEYSKGFKVVTSNKKGYIIVTTCHTIVTTCYKLCHKLCHTHKINNINSLQPKKSL